MGIETQIGTKQWRPLEKMFNEVPVRYDMLNRVITWRLDERWRKAAVRKCLEGEPSRVLDLCTGTGDLAIRLARQVNGQTKIQALDYSQPMLAVAREKADKASLSNIEFIHGDAASLPLENEDLDVIGIAFAFRNLTYKNPDRERFLQEIYRVLKPHGKFVIVESSQPENRVMKSLFRIYLKVFVAGIGGWLSGHKGAYRYLAASARNFYEPSEIKQFLSDTGFSKVEYRPFLGGIAGLTVATK
ncbi:MAG: bifunctional demethylmenaquinone methyltransferase/2-methoxy-6-polyprenyl-1,4-benzoquinol methylase UbiE [Bacteroidales bacterium]|jgi:demethylmenaquinone methyltransferase/2-methoxy-6-polyprenyl-1,4-benzoquinol methylase|nr:bifunctional demethylmenaquinone methyltransferase/2-methoxy-6-polyprenyl-1,4-benzoquinol methylase UbiE [Bacteroidales bacterium]